MARRMARAHLACLVLAGSLLLVPPSAAVPEADAGRVWQEQNGRPGVKAAGHTPHVVEAGMQWQGYLLLDDNVSFDRVRFQICIVGTSCFAPPTDAVKRDNRTWTFDTSTYLAPGTNQLIRWEAGWHLGVRYVIDERLANGTLVTTVFPHSEDLSAAGAEQHYLTFRTAAPPVDSPGVPWAVCLAMLAAAASRRR